MKHIEQEQEGADAMLEAAARRWCEHDMPSQAEFLAEFDRRRRAEAAGRPEAVAKAAATPRRRAFDAAPASGRRWYALAAAVILLLSLAGGSWYFLGVADGSSVVAFAAGETSGDSHERLQPGMRLTTGADGRALLALDGTRVFCYVNAGADLEYVRHDRVSLRAGELWFEVKPNSGRFEVATPRGSVVVHGTTFGVTVTADGVEAALATGSVSVESSIGRTTIEAGQLARISVDGSVAAATAPPDRLPPPWAVALRVEAGMANAARYFPSAHPPAGGR